MGIFICLQTLLCIYFLIFSNNYIGHYFSLLAFMTIMIVLLSEYLENPSIFIIITVLILNLSFFMVMFLNRAVVYKKKHLEERS
jgi:hypothetical protein